MKHFFSLLLVAILATGIVGTSVASTMAAPFEHDNDKKAIEALEASAEQALSSQQWTLFSERLVDALASDHSGLKQAAMRLVIRYGENVDVEDGVFDVMRVYRDAKDEQLRRMAVVTLANMKSDWAMKFLDRSQRFEKSSAINQTIRAVLAETEIV